MEDRCSPTRNKEINNKQDHTHNEHENASSKYKSPRPAEMRYHGLSTPFTSSWIRLTICSVPRESYVWFIEYDKTIGSTCHYHYDTKEHSEMNTIAYVPQICEDC